MNKDLHEEIIEELYSKYGISKFEISKIVASQFRLIERVITNKECKTISCIYLGKFYPTSFRKKLEVKNKKKENESIGKI